MTSSSMSSYGRRALVAAGLALAGNLVVWSVTSALGVDLVIPEGPDSADYVALTVLPVALASVIPSLAAGVARYVLDRLSSRSRTWFVVLVGMTGGLSLGLPFTLTTSSSVQVGLAAMHITTTLAVIAGLGWIGETGSTATADIPAAEERAR